MKSAIRTAGLTAAVFALVGIGLGLSGMIVIDYAQTQFLSPDAGEFAQSIGQLMIVMLALGGIMTTFFTGPTVGALTSLAFGRDISSTRDAALGTGLGSFVGFLLMTTIAVALIGGSLDVGGGGSGGSGGSVNVVKLASQILIASVPTTLVGAATAVLDRR